MELKDIWPVIIPGAFMQIFIQAYYIRHCWLNKNLARRQKAAYIATIVVFNIPAAAVYLFATRETSEKVIWEEQEVTAVDSQISQGIFVLLLVAYEIFSLRIISANLGTTWYPLISVLLGACFVIMIIHGLLVKKANPYLHYLLSALQIMFIFPVEFLNETYGAPFIILIVVAAIINTVSLPQAKKISFTVSILYLALLITKVKVSADFTDEGDAISFVYMSLLVYVLVFAAFYSLNKQLITNQQLAKAIKRLQEQALQLQKMSVIEERNRIAGEIHDTVGHTLTSAIITIEAGEALFANNAEEALNKFSLAKEQVKRGLNEIRNSVRAIHTGHEDDFIYQLTQLIREIKQHTGLQITKIVELKSKLLPIQKRVLLQTIKECATNSIKHGKSTELDLLLQEHNDIIRLTVSDNGLGAERFNYGLGLTLMQERIQSLGGTLEIDTAAKEGFTVSITLPAGKETGGKEN